MEKACDTAAQKFNALSGQTKAASARTTDISELQKHMGAYGKTQEICAQFTAKNNVERILGVTEKEKNRDR